MSQAILYFLNEKVKYGCIHAVQVLFYIEDAGRESNMNQNQNGKYRIIEDGYALVRTFDQVYQFFMDNGIIGKYVKRADMYTTGNTLEFGRFIEGFRENRHHSREIRMCLFGHALLSFVCEFTDGTFLTVDSEFDTVYSDGPAFYMHYGEKSSYLDSHGFRLIPPSLYGNLFNNLTGERLVGISMPSECSARIRCDACGNEDIESGRWFDFLYLDFVNGISHPVEIEFYKNEREYHEDSVGFYLESMGESVITFHSDRDIPYLEGYRSLKDE